MSHPDDVYKTAFEVIVATLSAIDDRVERFKLAGAFLFAAADALRSLAGDEITLSGLRTIIDAIETAEVIK